jgi:hypothetical protein
MLEQALRVPQGWEATKLALYNKPWDEDYDDNDADLVEGPWAQHPELDDIPPKNPQARIAVWQRFREELEAWPIEYIETEVPNSSPLADWRGVRITAYRVGFIKGMRCISSSTRASCILSAGESLASANRSKHRSFKSRGIALASVLDKIAQLGHDWALS